MGVNQKMCCMYSEVQFPPSKDIGVGCCGVGCCRTSDDAPPAEPLVECVPSGGNGCSPSSADKACKETKQTSSNLSISVSIACIAASLGSTSAMAASSSCPV